MNAPLHPDRDTNTAASAQPRSSAFALCRWTLWIVIPALLVVAALALWNSEWLKVPRALWELSRMPAPTSLPVPVEGVAAPRIADTFGAPRGRDRAHAGVDIFARRGTPVRSAAAGVVVAMRDSGLGGRQVWVVGPARERYYYAHLEGWREGLAEGEVVSEGTVLGYVGDSGNAAGTPPHLHWGIYGGDGAYDPLPLLRAHRATNGGVLPAR
ncbi:M23 family metallopeptidase [Stenotrophomonas sp. ISL-67]|uniref:M23 family metallopeptidase n=1 Tax=Stenotrophomonas sp. ISL-67 TaxID=2819171 RepID=UPI001BEAC787|nr:M23 family metallopeptidase [Stenotrophomonas sp. ISL-67]MBT2767800.1 M23 family metallopeptidase [Stenotrophomonas sp. ISL-67]